MRPQQDAPLSAKGCALVILVMGLSVLLTIAAMAYAKSAGWMQ